MEFEGRSYRNFNAETFAEMLLEETWENLYDCDSPDVAWQFISDRIESSLDKMCPLRKFRIKNYRPDWMTKELIEQIKDRDFFYRKAKGDRDYWNIAKYLRNVTNSNIRQAKKEFILAELRKNQNNAKKIWKVIRKSGPHWQRLEG